MRNLDCWDIHAQIKKFANKKHLNIEVLSEQRQNDIFTNLKKNTLSQVHTLDIQFLKC